MDMMGNDTAAEPWTNRYPWAYVDAAKAQLGRLVRGMSLSKIRPTLSDAQHLELALDDLAVQTALLRQMVAEVISRQEPYR